MLPSRYIIGEEYILDQDKIDVKIGYMFMGILFPWLKNEPILIDYPFGRLEMTVSLSDYSTRIFIYRKIPTALYDDVIGGKENIGNYFRGYLSDILTYITPILKRDVLSKGYITPIYPTQKNLVGVGVVLLPLLEAVEDPKFIHIVPALDTFPFSSEPPIREDIHDILEAMQRFIDLDISESLRYMFSALDTLRKRYLSKKEKEYEFLYSIKLLIDNTNLEQVIKETIFHNIDIGYALRNQIMHKSKRVSYGNIGLIHKTLSSILYLYKGLDIDNFDYYMELETQFLMVKNHYFGDNLDYLSLPNTSSPEVNSSSDLDIIMMENMRINYSRNDIASLLLDF